MTEFHRVFTLTLGGRTQMATEAKHAVQTAVSVHGELVDTDLRVVDGGITLVQKRNHITLELSWRGDNSLHQWLQNSRATFHERLTESLLGSVLE